MASNITLYDSEGNPQELTGDDIAQMGGMPVGGLINFGGVTAPAGFLVCDGTEVAKATYPDLYGAIGDVWGVAVDPLNFVLPDVAPEFVNDLVCIKAIHAVENLALVNVTQLMAEMQANKIISGDGWIKYPDGTMICYGSIRGTFDIIKSSSFGGFRATLGNFNYAYSFIEKPIVTMGIIGGLSVSFEFNDNDAAGNISVRQTDSAVDVVVDASIQAIGRWK